MLIGLIAIFAWVCMMRLLLIIPRLWRLILRICSIYTTGGSVMRGFITIAKPLKTLHVRSTFHSVLLLISSGGIATTPWESYNSPSRTIRRLWRSDHNVTGNQKKWVHNYSVYDRLDSKWYLIITVKYNAFVNYQYIKLILTHLFLYNKYSNQTRI